MVDARAALYDFTLGNWSKTPIALENEYFNPPENTAWIEIGLQHTSSMPIGLAGGGRYATQYEKARFWIKIYTPSDTGMQESDRLTQQLQQLFRNQRIDGVQVGVIRRREQGRQGTWNLQHLQADVDYFVNWLSTAFDPESAAFIINVSDGVLAQDGVITFISGESSEAAIAVSDGMLIAGSTSVAGGSAVFDGSTSDGALIPGLAPITGNSALFDASVSDGMLTAGMNLIAGVSAPFDIAITDGLLIGVGTTITGDSSPFGAAVSDGLLESSDTITGNYATAVFQVGDGVLSAAALALVGNSAAIAISVNDGVLASGGVSVTGESAAFASAVNDGALVAGGATVAGGSAVFDVAVSDGLLEASDVITGNHATAVFGVGDGLLVMAPFELTGDSAALSISVGDGALVGGGVSIAGESAAFDGAASDGALVSGEVAIAGSSAQAPIAVNDGILAPAQVAITGNSAAFNPAVSDGVLVPVAVGYIFPFDEWAFLANAIGLSPRRLRSAYSGNCWRIYTDDVTFVDIGFDDNYVDEAAIDAFRSGAECRLGRVYNQGTGGSDYDAVWSSYVNMPIIATASGINKIGGAIVPTNGADSDNFAVNPDYSATVAGGTSAGVHSSHYSGGITGGTLQLAGAGGGRMAINRNLSRAITLVLRNATNLVTANDAVADSAISCVTGVVDRGVADLKEILVNGSLNTSSIGEDQDYSRSSFFAYHDNARSFEQIIWSGVASTPGDRLAFNQQANDYWQALAGA